MEPLGIIVFAVVITTSFSQVLLTSIQRLTGHAASTDDIKQLTYMAYRFSNKITAVDTVKLFNFLFTSGMKKAKK